MSSKEDDISRKRKQPPNETQTVTSDCPYLDTIQRSMLDFDFEPSCSVSLQSGPHIYGCLVCGKFFRGRGPATPAYTHSVQDGHFVFVHLTTSQFYCLPDNYLIQDTSLQDIAAALHPSYTQEEVKGIDSNTKLARDLFGRSYLPGFVGLNNLNQTDCINATVQALAHVPPLRDYFLLHKETNADSTTLDNNTSKTTNNSSTIVSAHRMSQLVTNCFGDLVRKIWSDQRFKNHIDPHMLTQAIAAASNNRFKIGQQSEVGEFVAWFLHQLHKGLGGSDKKKKYPTSIIQTIFQGSVEVTTRQLQKVKSVAEEDAKEDDRGGSEDEDEDETTNNNNHPVLETEEIVTDTNFLHLTLDISQKPLFRNEDGGLVIPQEPLVTVLKKFDGMSLVDAVNSKTGNAQQRRYRIRQLPPYLILHLARFQSNRFVKEKNHTIVPFPVRNLDLGNYVFSKDEEGQEVAASKKAVTKLPSEEQIRAMSIKELKAFLKAHGQEHLMEYSNDKTELMDHIVDFIAKSLPDLLADKYDLVANITHDSPHVVGREGQSDPLQDGSYKCHVQHRGTKQWYEIQDLHVQEVMPQLIGLSESSLLIFERKSAPTLSYEPSSSSKAAAAKSKSSSRKSKK